MIEPARDARPDTLSLRPSPPHGIGRVLLFWLAYPIVLWIAAIPRGMLPPSAAAFGPLLWSVIAVPLLLVVGRGAEQRTPAAMAFAAPSRFRQFTLGAALGVASYAGMLGTIALLVTPLRLSIGASAPPAGVLVTSALSTLLLAWMEELGFRGYPLRTLRATVGTYTAHGIVAIAFAASHLAYGWPLERIVLGVLPFALLFGAAAEWSGGLAMPIGVHAAVNLARMAMGETATAGVFQIDVDPAHVDALSRSAPLVGAGCIVAMAVIVFAMARRRAGRGAPHPAEVL